MDGLMNRRIGTITANKLVLNSTGFTFIPQEHVMCGSNRLNLTYFSRIRFAYLDDIYKKSCQMCKYKECPPCALISCQDY